MADRVNPARVPCYMLVNFNSGDVYVSLLDEASWLWMHKGGPVPETQIKHITPSVLKNLEEIIDCDDDYNSAYERAPYVGGVFGPRRSNIGPIAAMSVSDALRYVREHNLEIVDAFTAECSI